MLESILKLDAEYVRKLPKLEVRPSLTQTQTLTLLRIQGYENHLHQFREPRLGQESLNLEGLIPALTSTRTQTLILSLTLAGRSRLTHVKISTPAKAWYI